MCETVPRVWPLLLAVIPHHITALSVECEYHAWLHHSLTTIIGFHGSVAIETIIIGCKFAFGCKFTTHSKYIELSVLLDLTVLFSCYDYEWLVV